jgi:O-antigen/teichoic acid export membrane protein
MLGVLAEVLHLGLLYVLLDGWGLAGAVGAQGLAPLPLLLPLAVVSMRRMRPRIRFDADRLGALLRRASPLLGALALNVVLVRIDVLMLDRLRGSAEVGLYAAPVRIVEVLNLLPILLMTSVYPLLARHAGDDAMVDRLFRVSLRVLTTIVVPVIALEIAFAGPIVALFFGDAYGPSAAMLPWLALSELVIFADIVIGARLVATGHETRNLQIVTIATLANVGANLALIPVLGGRGAALATLGAYIVRVAAGGLFRDTRFTTGLAFRSLAPATLAGLICFGPAMLFDTFRLPAFTFGVVAYPVALYLLGAIRVPEIVRLLAAFREASGRPD